MRLQKNRVYNNFNLPYFVSSIQIFLELKHSNKKWKNSVKTRRDLTILRAYVENQAKREPILLYRA